MIIQELSAAMRSDYVSINLKEKSAGVHFEQEIDEALQRENAVEDSDDVEEEAEINLKFLDRIQYFVARFKDTHFSVRTLNPAQPVTLGVYFTKARGKYYVSGVSQKIMAYDDKLSGAQDFTAIEVGDELLGFDHCEQQKDQNGCPPDIVVSKITPYISASSPAFAEREAVVYLTERNILFPERGYADLTIKHQKTQTVQTFKFPWFLSSASTRVDESIVLQKRKMNREIPFNLNWNTYTKKFDESGLENKGYDLNHSFGESLVADRVFVNSLNINDIAFRSGYGFGKDGYGFALLQLFSFIVDNVVELNSTKTDSVAYLQALSDFVKDVQNKGIPLIIDLRNNPGGYGSLPPQVLSLLAPKDAVYPGHTLAYRVNDYTEEMFPALLGLSTVFPQLSTAMDYESFSSLIQNAVDKKQLFTDAISNGPIRANPKIGGFDNKVVVLIGPRCISACDEMAQLFKSSGRARLLGEPTNGTGEGYFTTAQFNTEWKDTNHVIASEIPNYLFGRPGSSDSTQKTFAGQAENLNTENHPVEPDESYLPDQDDIIHQDRNWLNFVIKDLQAH